MRTVFWAITAMLVMLSAAPADMQISPVNMTIDESIDQARAVDTTSAHRSSVHPPCNSPDCAMESHCPTNMSMSDCDMGSTSCSFCGTTVLAHRTGEVWIQGGTSVAIQDPPNLILKNRSTSIFHPPRLAS